LDTNSNGIHATKLVSSFNSFFNSECYELFLFSYTKASVVAAIIFVLDKKSDLISAPHALVYFGIVIFLVYFKLSSLLLGIHGKN
jgi:TRIC channel